MYIDFICERSTHVQHFVKYKWIAIYTQPPTLLVAFRIDRNDNSKKNCTFWFNHETEQPPPIITLHCSFILTTFEKINRSEHAKVDRPQNKTSLVTGSTFHFAVRHSSCSFFSLDAFINTYTLAIFCNYKLWPQILDRDRGREPFVLCILLNIFPRAIITLLQAKRLSMITIFCRFCCVLYVWISQKTTHIYKLPACVVLAGQTYCAYASHSALADRWWRKSNE